MEYGLDSPSTSAVEVWRWAKAGESRLTAIPCARVGYGICECVRVCVCVWCVEARNGKAQM